jgi:large conductance mechanosensitive channel
MWKQFKAFAIKGNVIDMAVGIIIGAAFNSVVQSLVQDIIMPALSPVTGFVNFSNAYLVIKHGTTLGPYPTLQAAQSAGATVIRYGNFIDAGISFFIVSFATFLLVKYFHKLKLQPEDLPAEPSKVKECTYCQTEIPIKATRCPNCTSQLQDTPS